MKGEDSCTVPAGRFQLETALVDWSRQRRGTERTDELTLGSPTVKYGLGPATDIELTLTPFARTVTRDSTGRWSATGVGDSEVALKQSLSDGSVSVSLLPRLSLPTATGGLGVGKVETSVALPTDIDLSQNLQLNLSPAVGRNADDDGEGYHWQVEAAVGVTVPVGARWTLGAEGWAADDRDPAGHVHQASIDAAVTFLPKPTTQFDLEVDVGVTRATAGFELQFGISHLF